MNVNELKSVSFDRLLTVMNRGYISVCIYLNVRKGKEYHDIVIRRKIKHRDGTSSFVRGSNLKPSDLADLRSLLEEAEGYLSRL